MPFELGSEILGASDAEQTKEPPSPKTPMGLPNGDLQEIANQIRAMKCLWEGKGLDGLLKRRDAEADLVESCIA